MFKSQRKPTLSSQRIKALYSKLSSIGGKKILYLMHFIYNILLRKKLVAH
jgi:hypothetical protein